MGPDLQPNTNLAPRWQLWGMPALALRVWGRKTLLPRVWLLALAGISFAVAPGLSVFASEPWGATIPPTLTNASQILALSPEQAKAKLPVRIHGLVTCYDHDRVFFVQDETAGVFVYYTGDRLPFHPGQCVQVTGSAAQGRFSPIIDSPTIQAWETGRAIHPQPVSLAQVCFGGLDAQWVELTGVIRAQTVSDSRLRLELADPPHRIDIWIPNYQGYQQLPLAGSVVRVRGVVGSRINDRGQLEGFQLFANTIADITVLHPSLADPFSTPPRLLRDLKAHYVRIGAPGYVRVRGVVTLCWPGRALFIQDATGGLEVRSQAPLDDLVVPGTAVDVAGFLGPVLEAPLLEGAWIRKLGTNVPPQPVCLSSAEELFHGAYNNQLVEIEAQFLGRANSPSNGLTLALQAGSRFLTVLLDAPRPQGKLTGLEPGCRLRLTGVCRSQAGRGADPAVSLLLRSPMDVTVLSPPSPTRRPYQALAALAILASAGLAAALWLFQRQRRQTQRVLQRQVALEAEMRQGEQQLRRSIEERERIGRDLHDDIIQSIYAVGLGLEDCRRVVRQSPEQAEPSLVTAIHALNNTIRSVRGFIAGLEPKVLHGRDFKTALKSLALTSGDGPAQFQIEVDSAVANGLTSSQATQLLHIAKEAMSNSLRHAYASGLAVSLHPVGVGARLEIRDDGAGFDPDAVGGTGHGLRNMTTRARDIGAELQIISAPGQGCRILVTVPHGNSNEPD
jgi:signal transduction histidine kinase